MPVLILDTFKIDPTMLLAPFAAMIPIAVFLVVSWLDQKRRVKTETLTETEKLPRPAGYTLAKRYDQTCDAAVHDLVIACIFCAVAAAFIGVGNAMVAAPSQWWLVIPAQWRLAVPVQWWLVVPALLVLLPATAGGVRLVFVLRNWWKAKRLKLGLRGEQAVADVLYEVADFGYRAFHDLPGGDDGNLNHVAAGTRGVFLIETQARRKRKATSKQPAHVVRVYQRILQFPAGADPEAVPHAERNARWLSEFLSKKTGERVTVEPIVVLPGWEVERMEPVASKGVVMNMTGLASHLRGQSQKLTQPQLRGIISALDEKSRDTEF